VPRAALLGRRHDDRCAAERRAPTAAAAAALPLLLMLPMLYSGTRSLSSLSLFGADARRITIYDAVVGVVVLQSVTTDAPRSSDCSVAKTDNVIGTVTRKTKI